jgi:hypothetical protein
MGLQPRSLLISGSKVRVLVRPPSKSLKLRHDFAAAYTGRDCDVEIGSKEVPTLARMHTGPHPLRGCVSRDSSEIQDQKIEIKPRGGGCRHWCRGLMVGLKRSDTNFACGVRIPLAPPKLIDNVEKFLVLCGKPPARPRRDRWKPRIGPGAVAGHSFPARG